MAINPLQKPIDYAGMVPQVNISQGIEDLGAAFAKRQERVALEEQAAAYRTDLEETINNPTQEKFAQFTLKYPKQYQSTEAARKAYGEEKVKNDFNQGFEISTALESANPNVAKSKLEVIIEAKKNSGESPLVYQQILDAIDRGDTTSAQAGVNAALTMIDPDRFKKTVDALSASKTAPSTLTKAIADAQESQAKATTAQAQAVTAKDKAAADLLKAQADAKAADAKGKFAIQQELAELEAKKWNVNNLKSQINDRAAKLALDKQTTAATVSEKLANIKVAERNLPADVRTAINTSAVNAAASKQSANQFNDLAQRITAQGGNYGVASSASDYLKKLGGFQGGMTQLKQEYTRLRNTAAIKALPPGPATDRDIALALKGFPSETASATDLSNFLRGMAKLQDIDASIANAKTDWLANNNGVLTRARDTFIAGDYATKPNESFNDFTQRVVTDVNERYKAPAQRATPAGQQIPNEFAPTPPVNTIGRAVNDVRSAADRILEGR
jgi:2C-methyl-D-erythritol 2,4-cyclodiphosphate synthase